MTRCVSHSPPLDRRQAILAAPGLFHVILFFRQLLHGRKPGRRPTVRGSVGGPLRRVDVNKYEQMHDLL